MFININVDDNVSVFTHMFAPMFTLAVNISSFTGAYGIFLRICFINFYTFVYDVYTIYGNVSINIDTYFVNVYINVYSIANNFSALHIVS